MLAKNQEKLARKAFVRQHDQSDCGVACLVSIVQYFGGLANIASVREISGTSKQGTTVLGLYHAAPKLGLEAEAYEADIPSLKEARSPCILHVLIDKYIQHYVICYGFENGHFIISDPAKGIKLLTEQELQEIWQSKALLLVKADKNFQKAKAVHKQKLYWVKKLIEDDLNLLFIALFLGLVIAVLSLSTAIFSQRLIDDILPNKNQAKLFLGLGLLTFLLFVKSGLTYIRQYFLMGQTRDFNNRIVNHFYGKLLFLPKSFFDNRKIGELIARLNDTSRIQNTISNLISNVMIDILLIVISSVVIVMYSLPIGLIALTYIPLYFLIVYLYNNRIIDAQREVMASYAGTESNYVDTIHGIAAIKGQNKEQQFINQTGSVYDGFQVKMFGLGKVRIDFNLVAELVSTVIVLGVIIWSSFKVFDKSLKLGEMMAILQMMGMLLPSTSRLAMTNIQLQEAKVAFDRMFEFTFISSEYEQEKDLEKKHIQTFNELRVSNISFRFPGQKPLLHNISFNIQKGQLAMILGESGTGKSTLLQVLQKFYNYEAGSITVNDTSWNNISTQQWRAITACVPQHVKIFAGNVITNIAMGDVSAEQTTEIIDFCRYYGFSKYFEQFPQQYFTILGEEGINLSGGQQQLIAVARSLYKRPQLLILDESTAAMDKHTEAFVFNVINKARQENNMAVLMVTHRWQAAKNADYIYVMQNGTIQEHGTHNKLKEQQGYYAELTAN